MIKTNYFIITGGPGMGKTSLIDALRRSGHICVPETGRDIIQQQVAANGSALPWADRSAFAQLMFEQSVRDYHAHAAFQQPVFFDRGIPDVVGYLELCGLPLPEDIAAAAGEMWYNPLVFITPPWEEIFRNDEERKQSFEEAVSTYLVMQQTYSSLGYRVVELPKCGVGERVEFVCRYLSGK